MVDNGSLQSCRLCTVLKKEIDRTRAKREIEREELLNLLLKGHQEACHGPDRHSDRYESV